MRLSGRRAALTAATGITLGGLLSCSPGPRLPQRLLLVTVDTLRADRLGCYGQTLPLTPRLDALAAEGALLEQVIVPVPRTTQSTASLLTGLHPVHHGARGLFSRMPTGGFRTLAEILAEDGFKTAAFTSNLFLRPGQGFERGFALYDNPQGRWERNGAERTVEDALDWVRGQAGRRWFLWVHLLDPHWSYEPAPPFDRFAGGLREEDSRLFEEVAHGGVSKGEVVFGHALAGPECDHLRLLYDGEVAATDAAIGSLVGGLRGQGLLEGSLVVITADHGESLGEHGYKFAHGEYLYDDTLRVPALVLAPGLIPAGLRLRRLVRNFDLMPTILDLMGLKPPAGLDGISRARELRGGPETDEAREIYLESDRQFLLQGNPKRFLPGYDGSWRALRTERWKMIQIPRPGGDLIELYDLASDPGEEHDLSHSLPENAGTAERLASRLAQWQAMASAREPSAVNPPPPDNEQLRLLRSLGYVEAAPRRDAGN